MEDPIGELVRLLARLPGVGERTATRYVHHLLGEERGLAESLATSLATLHTRVHRCVECGNWGSGERCSLCLDPRRDRSLLCVVARVPDLVAIERGGVYRGRYHVLHALLAPLDGMGPERVDVGRVAERVKADGVREVVIATPLSVEGEATALYVAQALKGIDAPDGQPVRVSRIASGIPHGGELEYADPITLGRALDGRRIV
ncbi:MAG: recombination mediator RecR [Sandaracinus sp.]